jgi:hypothetical protein
VVVIKAILSIAESEHMRSIFLFLPRLRCVLVHGLFAFGLLGASLSAYAQSALLYGYEGTGKRLISFSAETPGSLLTDIPLTGLGASEFLLGIDFRPATGELYAVATSNPSTSRLVKIDTQSGAVNTLGANALNLSGQFFGFSFDALVDRIRLVSTSEMNVRINPNDGTLAGTDTALAYVSGDPQFGVNPAVAHVAYGNALTGATSTAYGIDVATSSLVRIGGIDGAPSANTGQLTTVGSLGVTLVGGPSANVGGFDIQSGTNTGYAALRTSAGSVLHTINLATGSATAIGAIGTGVGLIDGLAIVPPNRCLDLDGDGTVQAMTDGLMLVRALLGMTGTSVTNNALPSPAPPRPTWTAIRAHMNRNCGMNFLP